MIQQKIHNGTKGKYEAVAGGRRFVALQRFLRANVWHFPNGSSTKYRIKDHDMKGLISDWLLNPKLELCAQD
jgi:hypothetical protein